MIYHFCTAGDRPYALHLLVYLARGVEDAALDYADPMHLGGFAYMPSDDDEGERPHHFRLGDGTHRVMYEGRALAVEVKASVLDYKAYGNKYASKQFTICGLESNAQMERLLRDASAHVTGLLKSGQSERASNYVFDAEQQQFTRMGYLPNRGLDSLFLKETECETLLALVDGFLKSKAEYESCAVPYKLNVLLHGVPGTGKTSLITTMAAHFKLNVAVIPFSPRLTDDTLARGIAHACTIGCRIIALEDVDCLFNPERKLCGVPLTLSGLLNSMDGILRGAATGLIMFLTANTTEAIDEAVLRTARVDFSMAFTHADRYQTRKCYEFYAKTLGWSFAEAEWEAFWETISCFQFTTATLQQFFFRERVLDGARFKRLVHSADTTQQAKGFYQ
jgi:mitochondrial chaperone BCS1